MDEFEEKVSKLLQYKNTELNWSKKKIIFLILLYYDVIILSI